MKRRLYFRTNPTYNSHSRLTCFGLHAKAVQFIILMTTGLTACYSSMMNKDAETFVRRKICQQP